MSEFHANTTMPKVGHVTDLREQWLVRADGALANHLQDREISSHLCENRYRNQLIREDYPVALHEQMGIEHEAKLRELAKHRQAEIDAEIAREMAEINLRRQRRHASSNLHQPSSSKAAVSQPEPSVITPKATFSKSPDDINPDELGLSPAELAEMKKILEQEERDAKLARDLSNEAQGQDALLADMRCAVEAQDNELARLLQEREYKKLQRAKEKAKQKALLKKQQRLAAQHLNDSQQSQAILCDAYSNPRDMIRDNGLRLCKSVDSDLNYVEPFEKEHIESKASALEAKEISKQYLSHKNVPGTSNFNSFDLELQPDITLQHRQPPPLPSIGKKPRFPDPISIRPASHYPADQPESTPASIPPSYSENNNLYNSTYAQDLNNSSIRVGADRVDNSKRLSVISDITPEGLAKRKIRQADKKKKGCKIQ